MGRIMSTLAAAAALAAGSTGAHAATATRGSFGALPDGRAVEAVTLTNGRGASARIIAYGAILQALEVPDRGGKTADIVLGHATVGEYVAKAQYFGASVGRYANRIGGAKFTLDGRNYALPANNGPNTLHGGTTGFDKLLWEIVDVKSGAEASVTLRLVSPDGDQGFPGALTVTAVYRLNGADRLDIDYTATTTAPTIVNLTNHSYFNLAGESSGISVLDQRLTIPAEAITPVDPGLIPTGAMLPVADTPFDFRQAHLIGERIRDARDAQLRIGQGYDHNYVLARAPTAELRLGARVEDPGSGRVLEIWTDQPGMQFYSGNFLDGTSAGKGGAIYRQGDALALEPGLFPDTPNRPAFGSARLDPGKTYRSRISYRFSTVPAR